ncbi:hypothetical protein [Bacillus sp. B4EP4a]|uniref:hypothetical protein n=1 Tax=Bacillus sp. B4EP4a TaxID=2590665 RepID=UPI00256FA876|nr:hypothetical protein [Bacillus sp. B4EP4a]
MYLIFNAPSVTLVITFKSLCTISHKVFSKNNIGLAIGVINLGGMIGGFLAPMVMGYLIETFNGSFTSAFIYLIICAVLTIIATVGLNLKKVFPSSKIQWQLAAENTRDFKDNLHLNPSL